MPNQERPVVFHIPHSATAVPDGLVDWLISPAELKSEISRLTDWYTDELFNWGVGEKVVFPVSRLVCDPERFVDDAQEPAARVGMGVLYTHGSTGQRIADRTPLARDRILNEFYWPHHEALSAKARQMLNQFGECWVVDCHSFPEKPLPTETSFERPDICIGTDEFHTPQHVVQSIQNRLSAAGYSVAIDSPYAGTLIPNGFYQTDDRVKGLMIEVNRKLYLEENDQKTPEFDRLKSTLAESVLSALGIP